MINCFRIANPPTICIGNMVLLIAKPGLSQYTIQLFNENWSIPIKRSLNHRLMWKFIDRHLHNSIITSENIIDVKRDRCAPLFWSSTTPKPSSQINYRFIFREKKNTHRSNNQITKLFHSRRLKINWPNDLKASFKRWFLMCLLFSCDARFLVHLFHPFFLFLVEKKYHDLLYNITINLRQPENSHAYRKSNNTKMKSNPYHTKNSFS